MNTFWAIERGIFVFRNFIINAEMAEEVREVAEKRSKGCKLLSFKKDRRGGIRKYYDFPTHEQFKELLTHV
jgi:hypothetical protein